MFRRFMGVTVVALSVTLSATAVRAADPILASGKIDSVTVYRGQALVTRLIDVTAPAGVSEVIVSDLPERIIPGSVYAESSEGIEVRSVSYREHPVLKDISADAQKIDDQIRADQDALDTDNHAVQVLQMRGQYLDKLEAFAAPTATTELAKGILDTDVLKTLTAFIFDQRKSISDELLAISHKERDSQELLNLHQRQRSQ